MGGFIAFEWPRACAYWSEPEVQQLVCHHGLQSVQLDGCMFGLVSQYGANMGQPIRKPKRVDANSPVISQLLGRVCDGSHVHVPCQGNDTKATEGYTDEIVDLVHQAFATQCALRESMDSWLSLIHI